MIQLLLGSGGMGTPERMALWNKELGAFLEGTDEVLFVPYAQKKHDFVTQRAREKYTAGKKVRGIHEFDDQVSAVKEASAIFITGGNTFLLQKTLCDLGLIEPIRERVQKDGAKYIGISAGSNVACPTICNTNDMPIVYPPTFDSIGLIPFQLNAHYFAGKTHIKIGENEYMPYGGETRDDRIREYHEWNTKPVLGLWEGSILKVTDSKGEIFGERGARLFRADNDPLDLSAGSLPSDLL